MSSPRALNPWRRLIRWTAFGAVGLSLNVALPAWAGDRANVPLKNWGGFSLYRDAVYDDLERLVTAGLADRVLLNTKPLSRIEAAQIVARVIERIRRDDGGALNLRRDLEPVLDRLMDEFRAELTGLGVSLPGAVPPRPGFFSFFPVDRAQASAGFANRGVSIVDSQGFRIRRGFNNRETFESRAQIGDFLTFYVQPEFLGNEEFVAGRLATGYAKLTLYNVELLAGRDSLWWGPGLHGSLIMSNNAPPLDQIRIGAAEPFLLPWVGEWVGPTKLLFALAQLEKNRDHPRAKLAVMRGTISPFSVLELGASYANQFNGEDRPRLALGDYPRVLFDPPSSDQVLAGPEFRNNILFSLDADLRLRNVDRYLIPARDLRAYGEFGWDDTCCNNNYVPLKSALSGLAGAQFFSLFGVDGLELRLEWARSSERSFTHNQFYRGYWTRGQVISHFMGTEGEDYYARLTNWITPKLMLGIEFDRAVLGNTTDLVVSDSLFPKERRIGAQVDLSYRFWDKYSVFGAYQIMHVENRNFKAGDDGIDHVLRLELTRSFR